MASDNSSVSSGSQYSIDVGHLDNLLTGAAYSTTGSDQARTVRARARGTGHRRRISQARASRSSVYETIQEESFVLSSSPSVSHENLSVPGSAEHTVSLSFPQNDSVYIVDPETTTRSGDWDTETGILTLRKYYALRDEAGETVTESKKVWTDTAFSTFAMQCKHFTSRRIRIADVVSFQHSNLPPVEVAWKLCSSTPRRTTVLCLPISTRIACAPVPLHALRLTPSGLAVRRSNRPPTHSPREDLSSRPILRRSPRTRCALYRSTQISRIRTLASPRHPILASKSSSLRRLRRPNRLPHSAFTSMLSDPKRRQPRKLRDNE